MQRKERLIFNTALLTGTDIGMRCIGLAFQVWLVGRIGEAGIGLYQLVLSVGALFTTLAVSGIGFASTRLVSEELGLGRGSGVSGALRRCACYALSSGLLAGLLLYRFAEPLGFLWLGDARTVLPLRILALRLPCIALSSVLCGYFTATGRVWKSAAVHLAEELLCVAAVVWLLRNVPAADLARNCAAVTAGGVTADAASLFLMSLAFFGDRRRHRERGAHVPHLTRRMLGVALPLAGSAYARTALRTLEHLLIPRGLRQAGLSADRALAGYGVVQGIALPVVLFPACVLYALAELLVPELTAAQVAGRTAQIRRMVRRLLRLCLLFSAASALLLFFTAEYVGVRMGHSAGAAHYIRVLCPLVPIMYLDAVTDGCLRGLGQQTRCMAINVLDAALGVVLVWLLLPRCALAGYIAMLYCNECINLFLSGRLLIRTAGLFSGKNTEARK